MGITGHLTQDELNILKYMSNGKKCFIFCETGTYKAISTLEASFIFEKVYTIEISPILYNQVKHNNPNNNIEYIFGDSLQELPRIVKEIESQKGCMWFLDAHQSGSDTQNNGTFNCPLLEEIELILKNRKDTSNDIFVIDDVRLFGKDDWGHISSDNIKGLFQKYEKIISNCVFLNDRLIIYL